METLYSPCFAHHHHHHHNIRSISIYLDTIPRLKSCFVCSEILKQGGFYYNATFPARPAGNGGLSLLPPAKREKKKRTGSPPVRRPLCPPVLLTEYFSCNTIALMRYHAGIIHARFFLRKKSHSQNNRPKKKGGEAQIFSP